ncbi:MAG: hypothetical protein K2Z81_17690, partial [Cyanobacteria bacterium]|nr:hypothetical protein [Cyanobacteriota bacterium]
DAVKGTALEQQLEASLQDSKLLGNWQKLNELYNTLSNHGNKRIRAFVESYSREAVQDAMQESLRIRAFDQAIRDADLHMMLIGPKADIAQALVKVKELLTRAGFEKDSSELKGLPDATLLKLLKQRARATKIQEAIYKQVEQGLRTGDLDCTVWSDLADAAQEHRAKNAIRYFQLNGDVFNGRFHEGISIPDQQLEMLHRAVEGENTEKKKMVPREFEQLLGEFGLRKGERGGNNHLLIEYKDGRKVPLFFYDREQALVPLSYSDHTSRSEHVVGECYQEKLFEGVKWLVLTGKFNPP